MYQATNIQPDAGRHLTDKALAKLLAIYRMNWFAFRPQCLKR